VVRTCGNRVGPQATAGHPEARGGHACDRWEEAGYFRPNGDGEPFVISMPPPNVTGALHMGHAMFVTLQVRPWLGCCCLRCAGWL